MRLGRITKGNRPWQTILGPDSSCPSTRGSQDASAHSIKVKNLAIRRRIFASSPRPSPPAELGERVSGGRVRGNLAPAAPGWETCGLARIIHGFSLNELPCLQIVRISMRASRKTAPAENNPEELTDCTDRSPRRSAVPYIRRFDIFGPPHRWARFSLARIFHALRTPVRKTLLPMKNPG